MSRLFNQQKEVQTETCEESKAARSSSVGDVTTAEDPNEGLLKIIKVEDSGHEDYRGKTTPHSGCMRKAL